MSRLFAAPAICVARPTVLLSLGSNLQADKIKEGDDVYFDCRASASPPVTRLEWFHNVSECPFKWPFSFLLSYSSFPLFFFFFLFFFFLI